MIPTQVIAAWRGRHPWIDDRQVEQDLILTRLAVEIAEHTELRDRLVWRGGTCLHKIAMPEPLRYSEDLDYVAFGVVGADFGPVLSSLREVAAVVSVQTAAGKLVTERMSRGKDPTVTDELLVDIRAEWEAAGRPIVRPHTPRRGDVR